MEDKSVKKKKTYMKAEIKKKKAYKRQNVRHIWDMEKKSIIYIIEIPKEKRERDKGRNHTWKTLAKNFPNDERHQATELGSAINPKQNKYKENI